MPFDTTTPPVPRSTITVFRVASALTFAAVVMGSVVCATESGFECGTWPGCSDGALLPEGPLSGVLYRNPWIEMVHRASAILAGPFALAAAVLATRLRGAPAWLKLLPWVTVVGAIIAGYVGREIVLGTEFPTWVGAVDLGGAVLAMATMTTATIALERSARRWSAPPAARWAGVALGALYVMHLVSLWAAGPGSYTRCLSWPVWQLLAADAGTPPALQWLRLILAAVALVATVAAVQAAWRDLALRRSALGVGVLAGVVLALSLTIRLSGSTDLGAPYSMATVGLLFALVLLGARAALRRPAAPVGGAESRPQAEAVRS